MITYPFIREAESGLIVVKLELDGKHRLDMMVDTGASNTTVDINALYQMNYRLGDAVEDVLIETANGIITADIFEVISLSAVGLFREHFKVQVYDFLAHGILSDYHGVIGLDFFEETILSINLKNNTITVTY